MPIPYDMLRCLSEQIIYCVQRLLFFSKSRRKFERNAFWIRDGHVSQCKNFMGIFTNGRYVTRVARGPQVITHECSKISNTLGVFNILTVSRHYHTSRFEELTNVGNENKPWRISSATPVNSPFRLSFNRILWEDFQTGTVTMEKMKCNTVANAELLISK